MRARHLSQTVVLAVFFVLAGCSSKSESELLAAAKDSLHKNEPKTAVIQLKNALQQDPSSAEARFLLGQALLDSGDAVGAEIEFRRAQELQYPSPELIPLLAQSMLRQGEFDKLTKQFAEVELSDKPAMIALQLAVTDAYVALGVPDKARVSLGKALALDSQSLPALLRLAEMKAAAGEFDNAISELDALLVAHEDSADAWKLKGDLLVKMKSDAPGAIAAYQKALALRPQQAELHARLIALYFGQNDLSSATRQFDAMKAAGPDLPLTQYYAAQIQFAHQDFKGAQQTLQKLLLQSPENVGVLHLAGATEMKLGSFDQAQTYLARALLLQPSLAAARRLLAEVQLQTNQPARALSTLRPMLDTADADTLVVAGQASLMNGDAKAADGYFARAAAAGAEGTKARTARAMSQLQQGHVDTAVNELQSLAAADKSSATADFALISAYLSQGNAEAALKAIDALDRKQPASALAADLRGRANLLRRNLPEARKSFEQALQRDPHYLPAVTNLAAIDLVEKKPDAAKARFDKFLALEPKSVSGLLALAELRRRSGARPDEVTALITRAVSANPADPYAHLALINHHLANGNIRSALSAAQGAAAALPTDPDIQEKLARTLMASGEMDQAARIFAKMAPSPQAYVGLAETDLATNDFAAASENARRALELAPSSIDAQRVAALAAMGLGRPQDALLLARGMQTQRPRESLGYVLEGEIELNQQHPVEAATAFRKALSTANPEQAPERLHHALLQSAHGAEAAKFADDWLRAHPKDAVFLFYLADAAVAQGDLVTAEQRYRALLELQPNNAIALNNLASVLMKAGKQGALAFAERANKAAPGQPAVTDTLATALAADKQYARAIELEKQALAKSPNAAVLKLSLAKIYLRSGDKAQARRELEALLERDNDFPQRREASELLKAIANS